MCICKGGEPYYVQPYYSLSDAKVSLNIMVDLEKSRNRPYYVDNDFLIMNIHIMFNIVSIFVSKKEMLLNGRKLMILKKKKII